MTTTHQATMKPRILPALAAILTAPVSQAEYIDYSRQPQGALQPNAYGPNIARDTTGRAFRFESGQLGATPSARRNRPGFIDYGAQPLGEIRQNGYGLGNDVDETGRVFHAEPGEPGDD